MLEVRVLKMPWDQRTNPRVMRLRSLVNVLTPLLSSLGSITEKDLDDISFHYRSDRSALGFLADYSHTDVNVIQLSGKSTAVWAISPPSQVDTGPDQRLSGTD